MSRRRLDWSALRDRVDLAAVATALLGPPAGRQGRRLFWHCPFHDDRHPSFRVDPERQRWKCWPCDLWGDAVELVKRLRGVTFPEAVRIVADLWIAERATLLLAPRNLDGPLIMPSS